MFADYYEKNKLSLFFNKKKNIIHHPAYYVPQLQASHTENDWDVVPMRAQCELSSTSHTSSQCVGDVYRFPHTVSFTTKLIILEIFILRT